MSSDPTPRPQTAHMTPNGHAMTPNGPAYLTTMLSRNGGVLQQGATMTNLMNSTASLRGRKEWDDRQKFPEEALAVKKIRDLHNPDGNELRYDSRSVLNIIEEIIVQASNIIPGAEKRGRTREQEFEADGGFTVLPDELVGPINEISSELICKCHRGADVIDLILKIFESLAPFSWEAKVVICFAAFAMPYGEFWLVAQLYGSNPLAKPVGLLMEVPEIMRSSEAFADEFKALTNLVNMMLEVAKSMSEFKELLNKNSSMSLDLKEEVSQDNFATAAYRTVRSIVFCSSVLTKLMATGREQVPVDTWEIGKLVDGLDRIKELLEQQKNDYQRKLEKKRLKHAYLNLRRLFGVRSFDNMNILRALINPKDRQKPLYDCSRNTTTDLQVLWKKNVMIIISDLEIPPHELEILKQLYNWSRDTRQSRNKFELVWLPIVKVIEKKEEWYSPISWPGDIKQSYKQVQETMPWYSVACLSQIDQAVMRFITEDWKFTQRPMLVMLDPQGNVINQNAINMCLIWGPEAFPFTQTKEEELWGEGSWNMELLLNRIDDEHVIEWLKDESYICVFGGGDLKWIRSFTEIVKTIASKLNICIQLLYVGKSTMKETVKRDSESIRSEGLSHVLPGNHMEFFWERLNCMWNSREKLGLSTGSYDEMRQIVSILTFDSSDIGWAVIGSGREKTATKRGELMEDELYEFDKWGDTISDFSHFLQVLIDRLRNRHPKFHRCRWYYPGTAARAPDTFVCPECGKLMSKHIVYRCGYE